MKLLSWVLFFSLVFTSAAFAQQIQTSKSTLTLPEIGDTSNENGLRQAKAIAEIALRELGTDITGLLKEEVALGKEIAAYEAAKKNEQAAFDKIKNAYDAHLNQYESVVAALTAEILAFNALLPEQQDQGTLADLTRRKAEADKEHDLLLVEKTAGDNAKAAGEARLTVIYEPLQAKLTSLNAKLGLAYHQLKLCADYATQVNELLQTKFNKAEVHSRALDGAMEQLKALSGRGFDTP